MFVGLNVLMTEGLPLGLSDGASEAATTGVKLGEDVTNGSGAAEPPMVETLGALVFLAAVGVTLGADVAGTTATVGENVGAVVEPKLVLTPGTT